MSFSISCNNFLFKIYFAWYYAALLALLWLLFALSIFFHSFTFNLFVSLDLNWVFFKHHIVKSCFFKIYFANICLSVDEFNLTLQVITDKGFFSAIMQFVFYMSSLFFLSSSNTAFICCLMDFFSSVPFRFPLHFLFCIFYLFP